MSKVWIVYREYYDWDAHAKDNVRAFVKQEKAVLFMDKANCLHEKWCIIDERTWSKRKNRKQSWEDLLHDESELEIVRQIEDLMPEYKNGVDSRSTYGIESVQMETP